MAQGQIKTSRMAEVQRRARYTVETYCTPEQFCCPKEYLEALTEALDDLVVAHGLEPPLSIPQAFQ